MKSLRSRLRDVRLLCLDCDGVLTPGDLYYGEDGTRILRFHAKDGLGLALLKGSDLQVAVVSGRRTDIAELRVRELGVQHFIGQAHDKHEAVVTLSQKLGLNKAQCAFVGDDLPDLAGFRASGVAIAVADAAREVRAAADWVTKHEGGMGAVREACEALLKAKGLWPGRLRTLSGVRG